MKLQITTPSGTFPNTDYGEPIMELKEFDQELFKKMSPQQQQECFKKFD